MKCQNCGAEIGMSRFCQFCGSQISAMTKNEIDQTNQESCSQWNNDNNQSMRNNRGKIFKNRIYVIVSVIVIVLLLSIIIILLGTKRESSTNENNDSTNSASKELAQSVSPADLVFKNEEIGAVRYQIPVDWKSSKNGSRTTFYPPKSNDIVQFTCEFLDTDFTGMETVFFTATKDALINNGVKIIEESDFSVDGHIGRLYQYNLEARSGKEFKVNFYVFYVGQYGYGIVYGVDDSQSISYRPIYGYIIESAKILNTDDTTTSQEEKTTNAIIPDKSISANSQETTTKEPLENQSQTTDESIIRPEIKEAIDSYERFVDEYCSFMESYDSSDFSLLTKYFELLSKEIDMTAKFEALEDDLTDAEALYYAEVSLRCSQKMLQSAASMN